MLAVAASAAAHAVFVGLLLWSLRVTPEGVETPAIDVQLVRLRPPPPPSRPASAPRRGSATAPPHLAPPAPEAVPPPQPTLPAPSPSSPAAGLAPALRARLGCGHADLLHLTPEERRRCEDQLAAAGGGPRGDVALDLGRAGVIHGRNPEPYLARRPKNGCKVRAGGEQTPSGLQGPAAGVTCAWAF